MAKFFTTAGLLVATALFSGVSGYHWIAGFSWIDSLLEASMILGGIGPVNRLSTTGARIFASVYALFSGLMFIGVMAIVLTRLRTGCRINFILMRERKSNSCSVAYHRKGRYHDHCYCVGKDQSR